VGLEDLQLVLRNVNMLNEDNLSDPHPLSPSPSGGEGWGERVRSISIDHKALAGAVGLMCMSWLALPIVYWLIVRKKNDESKNSEQKESKPQK
jgi:hypothetical protein